MSQKNRVCLGVCGFRPPAFCPRTSNNRISTEPYSRLPSALMIPWSCVREVTLFAPRLACGPANADRTQRRLDWMTSTRTAPRSRRDIGSACAACRATAGSSPSGPLRPEQPWVEGIRPLSNGFGTSSVGPARDSHPLSVADSAGWTSPSGTMRSSPCPQGHRDRPRTLSVDTTPLPVSLPCGRRTHPQASPRR